MTVLAVENLPHVTEILRESGLAVVEWATQEDRDRGTAVHLATALHDGGRLDPASVVPSVGFRLMQYVRFKHETMVEILAVEFAVVNDRLRYRGRLDRLVRIAGREGVLDIKGSSEEDWHGAQLAGYALCFDRPLARWNLYLHDDRYRLVERTDRLDFDVFKSALTLTNWRRQHHEG